MGVEISYHVLIASDPQIANETALAGRLKFMRRWTSSPQEG
jgi:hypothetical protein